jgi:hypothetical protein
MEIVERFKKSDIEKQAEIDYLKSLHTGMSEIHSLDKMNTESAPVLMYEGPKLPPFASGSRQSGSRQPTPTVSYQDPDSNSAILTNEASSSSSIKNKEELLYSPGTLTLNKARKLLNLEQNYPTLPLKQNHRSEPELIKIQQDIDVTQDPTLPINRIQEIMFRNN